MKRRDFIKGAALIGAGLSMTGGAHRALAYAYSPTYLRKWVQSLRGLTVLGDPKGIPCLSARNDPVFPGTDFYEITAGEFKDMLHPQMGGATTLWGYYDSRPDFATKRHLGGLIIAQRGRPVRMRVTNALPADPIIPVDTSSFFKDANLKNRIAIHLHGGYVPALSDGGPWDWFAPGGANGPSFLNGPYGPDGVSPGPLNNIPDQPMLPGQADYYYPNAQGMRLMWYHDHAHDVTRTNAYAGLATGYLLLDDDYVGPNALYVGAKKLPGLGSTIPLIWQDKTFVGPTTLSTDPTWGLAIAPRRDLLFNGSLWYEHVYAAADQNPTPVTPLKTLPNPSCIPEFFGDTMLCNGTAYPVLTVQAKRYRFLMLNACNARFLNINLYQVDSSADGITFIPNTLNPGNLVGPDMIQIGNECGFLHQEVVFHGAKPFNPIDLSGNLQLGNAERADVIIDFTGQAGKQFVLYNDSTAPNPGGGLDTDYFAGNPLFPGRSRPGYGPDTRQLLRIKVVAASAPDPQPAGPLLNPNWLEPASLVDYGPADAALAASKPIPPLAVATGVNVDGGTLNLTLNEDFDPWGRLVQKLGTTDNLTSLQKVSNADVTVPFFGRGLEEPATEVVTKGTVQIWNVFNTTGDTHPIHFHLTNFQILWRAPFKLIGKQFVVEPDVTKWRGPDANELGWKETIRMNPGEVISLVTKWDMPAVPFDEGTSPRAGSNGLGPLTSDPTYNYHEYVWHCHILEHEEHDMMRPLVVKTPKV